MKYTSPIALLMGLALFALAADRAVTHATAEEASRLVAGKKVVVLDVRTAKEFTDGHIAGAKLVDFLSEDFESKLAAFDRNQTYLVHCATGGRSSRALMTLTKLGFKSVVHLDGGMKAWIKAGQPVQK